MSAAAVAAAAAATLVGTPSAVVSEMDTLRMLLMLATMIQMLL